MPESQRLAGGAIVDLTQQIVTARTVAEARRELVLSSALRPVEGSKDCRRAQPNSAGRGWAGVLAALLLGLRH